MDRSTIIPPMTDEQAVIAADTYWNNKRYETALKICHYDSKLWSTTKLKDRVLEIIVNHVNEKSKAKNERGVTSQLLPFEIYLLNDGFKIQRFGELNGIACYFENEREYKKGDVKIRIEFGDFTLNMVNNKFKKVFHPVFLFTTTAANKMYQVDNDFKNYKAAIQGKLTPYKRYF